jgi:hypothetical protein
LSVWLEQYAWSARGETGPQGEAKKGAEMAIRQIGTNAIPILLEWLRHKNLSEVLKASHLWGPIQRIPSWIPHPAWERNELYRYAVDGFRVLGADASPAVPEVIKVYEQNISEGSQWATVGALQGIGPAAQAAIPSFLRGTCSSNLQVRIWAVIALRSTNLQPSVVVPALEKLVSDTDTGIRQLAVLGLGEWGTNAERALPALVSSLSDPNINVRATATNSLKKIDPEAAAKAGVK